MVRELLQRRRDAVRRRGRPLTLVLVVLVVILFAGAVSAAPVSAGGSIAPPSAPSWEFTLQARAGTLDRAGKGEFDVRLTDVDPNALAFQDRPGRDQETVSIGRLVERLDLGRRQADPPNGVIAAHVGQGEQRQMGVELLRADYQRRKHRLTLGVRRLIETKRAESGIGILPSRFGQTSVFIDGLGHVCTASIDNFTNETLSLVYKSKWSTDDWDDDPPSTISRPYSGGWQSSGGAFRGCGNSVTYQFPNGDQVPVVTSVPWSDPIVATCNPTGSTYVCDQSQYSKFDGSSALVIWFVCYATNPNCGSGARLGS